MLILHRRTLSSHVVLSPRKPASCRSIKPYEVATQRGFGGPANAASIAELLPPVAAGAVAASAAPAAGANPFDTTSSAGIESLQRSSSTEAAPGPALRVCGGAADLLRFDNSCAMSLCLALDAMS